MYIYWGPVEILSSDCFLVEVFQAVYYKNFTLMISGDSLQVVIRI